MDSDALQTTAGSTGDSGVAGGPAPSTGGGFAEVAEQVVRDLAEGKPLAQAGNLPPAGGAPPSPKAPPAPDSPGAAEGDAPPQGEADGSAQADAELMAAYGFEGKSPEEILRALPAGLRQLDEWRGRVEAYGQQLEQRATQVAELERRLDAIAGNPAFRQALSAFLAGQRGGGAANPAGGRTVQPPTKFETDSERAIWEAGEARINELNGVLQQQAETIKQLQARMGVHDADSQQRDVQAAHADIQAAHAAVDAEFPELAKDAKRRKDWHKEASAFVAAGDDMTTALRKAARVLTFETAIDTGKRQTLEAARKAGRQGVGRPDATRSPGPVKGPPASLAEAGAQAIAERPELAAGLR